MIPLRASEFPQGHLRKVSSSSPRRSGGRTYRYLYGILDEGDPRYHVCDGWGMVLRILPPPIPGPMISPARPLPPGSGCSSCRRDVSPPPHAAGRGILRSTATVVLSVPPGLGVRPPADLTSPPWVSRSGSDILFGSGPLDDGTRWCGFPWIRPLSAGTRIPEGTSRSRSPGFRRITILRKPLFI
jgi:hypothetical protein